MVLLLSLGQLDWLAHAMPAARMVGKVDDTIASVPTPPMQAGENAAYINFAPNDVQNCYAHACRAALSFTQKSEQLPARRNEWT